MTEDQKLMSEVGELSTLDEKKEDEMLGKPLPTPQVTEPVGGQLVSMDVDNQTGLFELRQRQATLLSKSLIVPKHFRNNVPDCFIALDMAERLRADPLMVMQNLYIVHGMPAWSAKFLIACFNSCGRFSPIEYNSDGKQCVAYTTAKESDKVIEGPAVTLDMAKAEGWSTKAGSKWQTMPDLMLRYRAAAFLIRTVAPEISMGFYTNDEVEDFAE